MKIRSRDIEPFDFPGNEIGCLLIHGFTGSPGEMRPLGEFLHTKDYTVKGVLLPGHGTKVEDLARTNWQHWYEEVQKGYKSLKQSCEKIFIIGLSMGGDLALHLAANNKINGGIVSICAPIFLIKKKAYLAPILKYFVKYSKKKSYSSKNYESFWYDQYPISCTASLVKMLPIIKKELRRIMNPSLIIQSTLDKTVDPRSAQYIYDNIGSKEKEIYWLHNSGHIATLDTEREKVFLWIEEFIARNTKEES
ncbi:MAG: carboxylesterase [Clostridia bacterium]|jgi:carboxylesterase|nr:carboxylesterase [Clostridia bacterium]MDN5321894.1 carboxylesterase [Clostridia bacterium]